MRELNRSYAHYIYVCWWLLFDNIDTVCFFNIISHCILLVCLCSAMDDIFGRVWIRCSQLAVLIITFKIGRTFKTEHVSTSCSCVIRAPSLLDHVVPHVQPRGEIISKSLFLYCVNDF